MLDREVWDVGKYLVSAVEGRGLGLEKVTASNLAWKIGFVADQLHDGTPFGTLAILGVTQGKACHRSCQGLKGEDVVRVLKQVKEQRRVPKFLFCGNGKEFTSQPMDLWAYQTGMNVCSSRPGKPDNNAFVEPFNGTFRMECLDTHRFGTLSEAKRLIEQCLQEYNKSLLGVLSRSERRESARLAAHSLRPKDHRNLSIFIFAIILRI